jgi:hypothetical protein
LPIRPALFAHCEALKSFLIPVLQALERPFLRTKERHTRSILGRPMLNAAMLCDARFNLAFVQNLAPGPGHVDAAPKLIETLGDRADSLRVIVRLVAGLETPRIEQRIPRIEEAWPDGFRRADISDAPRITSNSIEVVVRHVVLETLPIANGWCGNHRPLERLQPGKRSAVFVRQSTNARRTGDQRLEQPRRRRWPISGTMVASVMEADREE